MSNSFCQQKASGLFGDMVILGQRWEKPIVKLGYLFTLSKKSSNRKVWATSNDTRTNWIALIANIDLTEQSNIVYIPEYKINLWVHTKMYECLIQINKEKR